MLGAVHCLLVSHGELQIAEETIIIICPQENVTIRVRQLLPFHPLTHIQVLGAVHCLLVPHDGMQIAEETIIIICPQENVTIRVRQLLPFHPLTHIQVSGAVHCLLVPHGGLQIAMLRGNKNYVYTRKRNHTCLAVIAFPSNDTYTSVRSCTLFVSATWWTANCCVEKKQ